MIIHSPTIEARRDALTGLMRALVIGALECTPDDKESLRTRYEACKKELDLLNEQEQEFDNWWKIGKES